MENQKQTFFNDMQQQDSQNIFSNFKDQNQRYIKKQLQLEQNIREYLDNKHKQENQHCSWQEKGQHSKARLKLHLIQDQQSLKKEQQCKEIDINCSNKGSQIFSINFSSKSKTNSDQPKQKQQKSFKSIKSVRFKNQKQNQNISHDYIIEIHSSIQNVTKSNLKHSNFKQSNIIKSNTSILSKTNISQQSKQHKNLIINNQIRLDNDKEQDFIKVEKSQGMYRCKKIKIKDANMLKKNFNSNNQNQQEKQCRICLQNQKQGKMIRPCICSGSINYVHQKCISQWIFKKIDLKGKKKIHCQVCDFQYKYQIIKHRELSCQEYHRNFQHNKGTFKCFYLIMTILFLGLFAAISTIIASTTQTQVGTNLRNGLISTDSARIIFSCVCFLFFNILLFAIILFIVQYGVKLEITIQDVLDIADIPSKKKSYKLYPKKVTKKINRNQEFSESRNGIFQ